MYVHRHHQTHARRRYRAQIRVTAECCCVQVTGVGRYPVLQQMYRNVRGGLSLVSVIHTSLLHHLAAARPPEVSPRAQHRSSSHLSPLRV